MNGRTNLKTWQVISIFFLTIQYATAFGDIIYVNVNIPLGGDGSSWTNAYNSLQDALAAADPCDKIWVAEGIYKPDQGSGQILGDRKATFSLIIGVALYGGFAATGEPAWEDRDPNKYVTILSGDLLDNDNPATPVETLLNDPCRADNSYHVFYHPTGTNLDTTAILDGCTITAGNASGDGRYPYNHTYHGGGMYSDGSSPTVTGCTFRGNSSRYHGGGIYNGYNSPVMSNCSFTDNSAGYGGGMYNLGRSPNLTNCTFRGNSASWGGGMYNLGGNPMLTNCTFSENSAVWHGGGVYNHYNSPTLTVCTFNGNTAEYGGGMYNYYYCSPTVTNCTFSGNSADYGGGMHNRYCDSPIVTGCSFSDNLGFEGGGGISNNSSSPTVTNCKFSGNSTEYYGGGMFNVNNSSPVITNCTFSGNSAQNGGGIYNYWESRATVNNCILWGNTTQEIYNYSDSSNPIITYSDIRGGWEGEGHSNIDIDPKFVDSENGDLHLLWDSPCIDAGDPNYFLDPNYLTDLDGNPRIVGGRIDMGAYEMADPVVLLDFLYQDIIALELKQGTENSLLAKLDTALRKLKDDNENNNVAVINVLEAFINTVDAWRDKKISKEDADYFITAAQQIIDLLSND